MKARSGSLPYPLAKSPSKTVTQKLLFDRNCVPARGPVRHCSRPINFSRCAAQACHRCRSRGGPGISAKAIACSKSETRCIGRRPLGASSTSQVRKAGTIIGHRRPSCSVLQRGWRVKAETCSVKDQSVLEDSPHGRCTGTPARPRLRRPARNSPVPPARSTSVRRSPDGVRPGPAYKAVAALGPGSGQHRDRASWQHLHRSIAAC